MALITVTTDLGNTDYYLAALKGSLYSSIPDATIVDVSVSLRQYDIKQAAYTIKNVWKYFPKGTIHLVVMNPDYNNEQLLIAEMEGHFFVCFDNGILPLAFGVELKNVKVFNPSLLTNHNLIFTQVYAQAVASLAQNKPVEEFTHPALKYITYNFMQPSLTDGQVRGSIVSVDSFGNAISNISRKNFEDCLSGRRFIISFSGYEIRRIIKHYGEEEMDGELMCLFNSNDFLEIGIKRGRANTLLGLRVDDTILISANS
jgi:S-adenosylmethionine hydrolase